MKAADAHILFYVQHLLGVGHVYRATRIASALQSAGFPVHLVWGGTRIKAIEPENLTVHFLPPVRTSNADFNALVHPDGSEFTQSDRQARSEQLLRLYDEINPAVVITEAFPFGRRQMFFELLPLLERAAAANPRPLMISSIRDIMQEGRKQKRVRESVDLVNSYFDLVLVHGDAQLVRIEETLQGVAEFSDKIRYTGLVTPSAITASSAKKYDVVVSAGGGAFGRELLENALLAKPLCAQLPGPWLVTAGSEISGHDFSALQHSCPDGVELVRFVPDLAGVLRKCRVSVSHAGYNTVADILRARCRSVLYPHTGGKETEQLRRAQLLHQRGIAQMIAPGALTPQKLAEAVKAASNDELKDHELILEGAENSAAILVKELQKKAAIQ